MTTPFPPAKSRLHLRVVETFGPGLRFVVDAHPLATGTRLAKGMGAELAVDLPAAVEALVARVDAAEHRRSLERVERVTRLQRKLKTYSPDTDRELIDQHADLTAALALSADAGDSMPDIERLLERMTSTRAVLAAAQDDLDVASKAVTFLPPTTAARPDAPGIILSAHRDAATAASAYEKARDAHAAIVRLHEEVLAANTDGDDASVLSERGSHVQRRARAQGRRLLRNAGLLGAGAILVATATAAGMLPVTIGLALALAFVPPAFEQLRRLSAIRGDAERGRVAAGARSLLVEYGRRGDEEALRARRVEAAGVLTRAEQLSAAALRRWWSVAGSDASLDDLDRILQAVDVYIDCTAARDRAAARASAAEKLLERAVDEVGLEPGLDLAVTVDRLRHLVALRPHASELLREVADARLREVERLLLSSLIGGKTLRRLNDRVRAEPTGSDDALVIVDDGDDHAHRVVSAELARLDGRARVVVVTTAPDRWPNADAPSTDEAQPAPSPTAIPSERDRSEPPKEPEPDRPWFMTR
jgi:hypothetical protein